MWRQREQFQSTTNLQYLLQEASYVLSSCISPWTMVICCACHVALIAIKWILFGLEENVIFMAQQGLSKRIWITGNRENIISCWHNIVPKSWFSFWVTPKTTLFFTTYFGFTYFCSSFRIELFSRRVLQSRKVTVGSKFFQRVPHKLRNSQLQPLRYFRAFSLWVSGTSMDLLSNQQT